MKAQNKNILLTKVRLQMRDHWIVIVFICVVVPCQAQTAAPKTEKSRPSNLALAEGRRRFESICASCHGLNGRGGERAPDIATRPEVVRLSDSETLRVLQQGVIAKGMPPFASLGLAKLSAVLTYLRLLQGKDKAPAVTANAEQGKHIFAGKGGCLQCHTVRGAGGFIGPDLSDYGAIHSPDDIRGAIVSADKRPLAHKGLAKATTKDGQQVSGLVRNEDNFSLQLQTLDGAFHSLDKSTLSDLTFDTAPVMPDDYESKLSQSELDQLVAYLSTTGDVKK